MPDHYHLLIRFADSCNPQDFLRDFKSLAGRNILVWLRERNFTKLLARFSLGRRPNRRKDPNFSLLEYGCYKKHVLTEAMLWQKLSYIHGNPVRARLVEKPEDYTWSSARAYATGVQGVVKVDLPF